MAQADRTLELPSHKWDGLTDVVQLLVELLR